MYIFKIKANSLQEQIAKGILTNAKTGTKGANWVAFSERQAKHYSECLLKAMLKAN